MGLSEHITPHGLRRTATTHLARLQVLPFIRNRITAHTGAGDTIQQIYDRYDYFEEKLAALEKWANEIQRLIAK
jgi:integrase